MAEPLKNQFGIEIPEKIARMIVPVHRTFDRQQFIADCMQDYDDLSLTHRARHIANKMANHLPSDFVESSQILIQSLGPKLDNTEMFGLGPFLYLPFVYYASEYGLEHYDQAMELQYQLTQRFTAEFSIRAFILRYPEQCLQKLRIWTTDPSPHVRRLVSEGTRPRLPWAPVLRPFVENPAPILPLLEQLKDDADLYVRRSVANNLNDIAKDHPHIVNDLMGEWVIHADANRMWLIKHALRTLIKKGNPKSLTILGYSEPVEIRLECQKVTPTTAKIGGKVTLSFELVNQSTRSQKLVVDCQVHFIKANGQANPKVFKVRNIELAPCTRQVICKTIGLQQLTTRTHYTGEHKVTLMVNGRHYPTMSFMLIE